jgi:hypothetical protein
LIPRYECLINRRVPDVFDAAEDGGKSRLLAAWDHLSKQPEQPYDFLEQGLSGLEVRCKWFGNWLIRYRVESPVRQVIVLHCQWT